MNYIVLNSYERAPATAIDTAYLSVDNWNDYSFVTMFYLTVFDPDEQGAPPHKLHL